MCVSWGRKCVFGAVAGHRCSDAWRITLQQREAFGSAFLLCSFLQKSLFFSPFFCRQHCSHSSEAIIEAGMFVYHESDLPLRISIIILSASEPDRTHRRITSSADKAERSGAGHSGYYYIKPDKTSITTFDVCMSYCCYLTGGLSSGNNTTDRK